MVETVRGAIGACWVVFIVVWVIAARSAKRTAAQPGGQVVYRIFWLAGFALLFMGRPRRRSIRPIANPLIHVGSTVAVVAFAVTIAGLLLAFWARATLGGNWSGNITLKEDHTLVQTGPYRTIRHPIYTAILLMFLGSALAYGTLGAIVGVPLCAYGFVLKAHQEEALMQKTFPDAYPAYRDRTKMLLPGVF